MSMCMDIVWKPQGLSDSEARKGRGRHLWNLVDHKKSATS